MDCSTLPSPSTKHVLCMTCMPRCLRSTDYVHVIQTRTTCWQLETRYAGGTCSSARLSVVGLAKERWSAANCAPVSGQIVVLLFQRDRYSLKSGKEPKLELVSGAQCEKLLDAIWLCGLVEKSVALVEFWIRESLLTSAAKAAALSFVTSRAFPR